MQHLRLPLVAALASAASCADPLPPVQAPTPTPEPAGLQVHAQGQVVIGPETQHCTDPGARRSEGPFETLRLEGEPTSTAWVWGSGVVVGDLDGDGWLELWMTEESGLVSFTSGPSGLTPSKTPAGDLAAGSGGVVADYDGDGDLDVYLARWVGWPGPEGPGAGRNRLLRNDGDGTFTDVTEAAGGVDGCTPGGCLRSVASSFGDYDRDGDLDLFVGSHGYIDPARSAGQQDPGEPSFLYRNNGDGTFTDVSDLLPEDLHESYTLGGGFIDLDADGWLDLYSANDVGHVQPNVVLWNRQGTLVHDPGEASGLVIAEASMGLAAGDLNGDLRPDLVIPAWGELVYLQSVESIGVWVDATESAGLQVEKPREPGWGSELFDIDNDGDLDLITQFGWLDDKGNNNWRNDLEQPDALFLNEGTSTAPAFVDRSDEWGLGDLSANRSAAVVDLNRDGYLDIVKRDLLGSIGIWLSRCGDAGWLRIRLEQPGTLNRHAVGARIRIFDGDQSWTRTIRAGGTGLGVGLPPEVHFGLGDRDTIDRIEVIWPDGAVSSYDHDLPTRRELRIVRQ